MFNISPIHQQKINSIRTIFSPIRILLMFLSLMAIFATNSWGGDLGFWVGQAARLGLIYVGMNLAYFVLDKFFVVKDAGRWENRVISTLILYLLFDPLIPYWVFFGLGVVTEVTQRIFRSLTGPIVNPSAGGALAAIGVGFYPGWWGMSFAPRIFVVPDGVSLAVFLTAIMAGYVAYKYKKLFIIVVAGLLYFMLATFFKGSAFSFFVMMEGTILFWLLVMVVEPKSSPALERDQLIYGLIIGSVSVWLLTINFADPYIGSLIVANVCNFLLAVYMKKNKLQLAKLKLNDKNKISQNQ